MQVGSLVKHIEFGYIGILVKHGGEEAEYCLVHWNTGQVACWYSECELEVLCK